MKETVSFICKLKIGLKLQEIKFTFAVSLILIGVTKFGSLELQSPITRFCTPYGTSLFQFWEILIISSLLPIC